MYAQTATVNATGMGIAQFQKMLATENKSQLFQKLTSKITPEDVQEMQLLKAGEGTAQYWAGWWY